MEIARCWVFVRKGNRQGAVRWMPVRLEALLKLVLDIIDHRSLSDRRFQRRGAAPKQRKRRAQCHWHFKPLTAAFGHRTSRAEGNGLPKIKPPATHG